MKQLIGNGIKIFKLVCLILFFSTSLNAQSIILKDVDGKTVNGDTIEVVFHPSANHGWTELTFYTFLKNISNDTLEVGFKKKEFNLQTDVYHSFCFAGSCFDSSTHVAPYNAIIPPADIDSSFSGHFRFDDLLHFKNKSLVSYTFYNVNNTVDSAVVYVIFNTLLQSWVDKSSKANVYLSKAFPNPVKESININYNLINIDQKLQPYLIISNSLGEIQQKQLLSLSRGSVSINTISWKPGLYYYFIMKGNVLLAGDKCMIIH